MKYIGKRTCYCPIEDDDYLGSGTFLKQAVEIYGKQYFKKQILFICETEEEVWEKEKEVIQYLDAANSKEYYNVALGGPSRPDGLFLISDSERDKMDYLNAQLKNEEYCGVRLEERDYGKPRIIFIETMMYHNKKHGMFTTIDDDTGKMTWGGEE